MRLIIAILLLFTVTACSSPTESTDKANNKESVSREMTKEEQNFIDLIKNDDYETLLKQTEDKTNEVQEDYYYLATAFDKENKLEEKVQGVDSEFTTIAIYKAQYEDIKNSLENVKYVSDEIKEKVDDLYTLATEKFAYYSQEFDEENELVIEQRQKDYQENQANITTSLEDEMDYRTLYPQPVKIGMTREEVLTDGWGRPNDINRTTTAYGVSEQWVYDNYKYLYFEDGILTSIQN